METLFYPVRTWAALDKVIVVDTDMRCKTLESYSGWERALQNPALRERAQAAGGPCLDLLKARDAVISIDSSPGGSLPDDFALISTTPTQTEESIRSCQNKCGSGCEGCQRRLLKSPSPLSATTRGRSAPPYMSDSDDSREGSDFPILRRRPVSPPPQFEEWEKRLMTASPIAAQDENYDYREEFDEEEARSGDEDSPSPTSESTNLSEESEHLPIPWARQLLRNQKTINDNVRKGLGNNRRLEEKVDTLTKSIKTVLKDNQDFKNAVLNLLKKLNSTESNQPQATSPTDTESTQSTQAVDVPNLGKAPGNNTPADKTNEGTPSSAAGEGNPPPPPGAGRDRPSHTATSQRPTATAPPTPTPFPKSLHPALNPQDKGRITEIHQLGLETRGGEATWWYAMSPASPPAPSPSPTDAVEDKMKILRGMVKEGVIDQEMAEYILRTELAGAERDSPEVIINTPGILRRLKDLKTVRMIETCRKAVDTPMKASPANPANDEIETPTGAHSNTSSVTDPEPAPTKPTKDEDKLMSNDAPGNAPGLYHSKHSSGPIPSHERLLHTPNPTTKARTRATPSHQPSRNSSTSPPHHQQRQKREPAGF